jgi:hypothetical protein
VYLHGAEPPQHAVPEKDLDKTRNYANGDQCEQYETRGSQHRCAPNDYRLPRDEQNKAKPEDAMDQCRDLGRDWRTGSEGNSTRQDGAEENCQQGHIGAATRTPHLADMGETPPEHGYPRRSGKNDVPG